jgi:spore germination protein
MPYAASEVNGYEDEKDAIVRFPFRMLKRRPVFARRDARVKLRKKE